MARHAIIDGDGIVYRVAAASEKKRYLVQTGHRAFEDEFDNYKEAAKAASPVPNAVVWTRSTSGELRDAIAALESIVERSIARSGSGVFSLFLGDSAPTFRHQTASLRIYKGNRNGTATPVLLPALRDYLCSNWGAQIVSGVEVDDYVSILHREVEIGGAGPGVVVGNDKDLDQIPGEHYDWVKDKFYTVSNAEARLRLWVQTLSGDVADNVGGCWGVGEVRARALLERPIEEEADDTVLWGLVIEEYKKSQSKEDCPYKELDAKAVAKENHRLVKLCTYRFETLEPTLEGPRSIPFQVRKGNLRGPRNTGSQI